MSKYSKIAFLFLVPILSFGQNCQLRIHGRVVDEVTGAPLPYVTIYLESLTLGKSADEEGYFQFDNVCPGSTHLRISHVSCEPLKQFISIEKDTVLTLYLHHHEELMDEVLVHGDRNDISTQNSSTIDRDMIAKESNKNLGDLLQTISGVSTLKTGSGISKPVIDGLYGNRITLLNNGIAQAGQQWGSDHAPEIDPFSADHISVIKGVNALEYSGSSLGGVVLIESDEIKKEPHLHGNVNYIFQSNGRGHTFNVGITKYKPSLSWRFIASAKGIGDQRSANYFLTNTGRREANGSLMLEKPMGQWKSSLYFSTFNTEIAILRGSHIGNLSDLQSAFDREIPFFTEDNFSYQIYSPYQKVSHQLLKIKSSRLLRNSGNLVLQYAGQLNDRKEFDVRRGGRSNEPSLSLFQLTHFLEGNYSKSLAGNGFIKTGLQWDLKDNTNKPGTGILPLIPDFISATTSGFTLFQKESGKAFYEVGGRFDIRQLNVAAISRELPRIVERFIHVFPNYGFSTGVRLKASKDLKFNLNAGYTLRAPAVNELYSFGLHQGVSSIEIGNKDLHSEKSLKFTGSVDVSIQDKLYFQVFGYIQSIADYIYLKPNMESALTIRGAFPVFNYEQTNASLTGADFLVSYEPFRHLRIVSKAAILKGNDNANDVPLVFMPPNNLSTTGSLSFKDSKTMKSNSMSLEHRVVFEQRNLNSDQDFIAAPETYQLWDVAFNTSFQLPSHVLTLSVKMENVFNISYRDYLNRQRYFADELGRNINLRLNYLF